MGPGRGISNFQAPQHKTTHRFHYSNIKRKIKLRAGILRRRGTWRLSLRELNQRLLRVRRLIRGCWYDSWAEQQLHGDLFVSHRNAGKYYHETTGVIDSNQTLRGSGVPPASRRPIIPLCAVSGMAKPQFEPLG